MTIPSGGQLSPCREAEAWEVSDFFVLWVGRAGAEGAAQAADLPLCFPAVPWGIRSGASACLWAGLMLWEGCGPRKMISALMVGLGSRSGSTTVSPMGKFLSFCEPQFTCLQNGDAMGLRVLMRREHAPESIQHLVGPQQSVSLPPPWSKSQPVPSSLGGAG